MTDALSGLPETMPGEALFYQRYGMALAAWARIEAALFLHFQLFTAMDAAVARDVFYSARSLRGRLDMLDAAMMKPSTTPDVKPFLKVALKRTGQWAGVRNAMAHGEVMFIRADVPSKYAGQHIILDGSEPFSDGAKGIITVPDLIHSWENFGRLCHLLLRVYRPVDLLKLKECNELVQLLPTRACENEKRRTVLKRFGELSDESTIRFPR